MVQGTDVLKHDAIIDQIYTLFLRLKYACW